MNLSLGTINAISLTVFFLFGMFALAYGIYRWRLTRAQIRQLYKELDDSQLLSKLDKDR